MKKIFIIDWVLIPAFILSAAAGIGLHNAGHGNNHEVWHDWAVAHILFSLLFTTLVMAHIKTHWAWYTSLFRNGLGRKSHVTVIVSILFMLVALTGCVLLGVEGANSGIGLWHYRIGLLSVALFGGHIQRNKNYVNFFQQGTMPILTEKHFLCRDLFLASACFPIRAGMFSDLCG